MNTIHKPEPLVDNRLLAHFRPVLVGGAPPVVRDSQLLMDEDRDIKIYYAPFEYVNPDARVALVGITPGPTQMVNANHVARLMLLKGASDQETMKAAKQVAAFSGEPMRSNLVRQLNHWGFPQWLGLNDASELFGHSSHLVHTTSLLRFPVFVQDDDYRGTPNMTKHSLLRKYLMDHFAKEVEALGKAVFLGFGPKVQRVLDELAREGVLPANRIIGGMLHPSGKCTYRINYLTGHRVGSIPHATNPRSYDQGRATFQAAYL